MKKFALALLALLPLSALADAPIYSCSLFVTNAGSGGRDFVDGPHLTREILLSPGVTAEVGAGGTYRNVLRVGYRVNTTSIIVDDKETQTAMLSLQFQTPSGGGGTVGSFPIDAEADTLEVRMNEFGLKGVRLTCELQTEEP